MGTLKLKKEVKKYLIFIVIGLIALIGIILLIKSFVYHRSTTYKFLELGYNESEINLIEKNLTSTEIDNLLDKEYDANIYKLMNEKYYLNKNLNDYLDYLSKNANAALNDIVAIVNVGADKEWYDEDTTVLTNTSKNELMLINKFHKLDMTVKFDDLKAIPLTYAYSKNVLREIALEKFIEMYNAAKSEGLSLIIAGSYRTYEEQQTLYDANANYGGVDYADQTSARYGHSDHQSGLAIDIAKYGTLLINFETTNEFTWLQENAYKYGFILRYPKDKEYLTGFTYEPWHYRYVGIDAATAIYNEDITFDEYYAYYVEK